MKDENEIIELIQEKSEHMTSEEREEFFKTLIHLISDLING
jgi:hypothetical protein